MRRYPPFYEGDDILRPDAALGESDVGFFISSDFATGILKNNLNKHCYQSYFVF